MAFFAFSAGTIAALGLFAAACGDDDSGGSSGGGNGSDASYVSAVCKAQLKLEDAFSTSDPSKVTDAKSAIEMYTKPLDQYVKDMKAANPPKDVKTYHDQLVKAFEDATAKLKKDSNPAALGDINSPEPPQAIKDRLTKAATADADCQKAGFSFD
jgi:hypothetical protein